MSEKIARFWLIWKFAGLYVHCTKQLAEMRLPTDGKYLIYCRGSMGNGRDQVMWLSPPDVLLQTQQSGNDLQRCRVPLR